MVPADEGAFCKFCVLFGKFSDKHISTVGTLVKNILNNWKKATEKLESHFSKTAYHVEA